MKTNETKRMTKVIETLEKIVGYLEEGKAARALRSTVSLHNSLVKRVNGSDEKREPTEYNVFMKQNYDRVRRANPQADFGELSRIMADLYRESKGSSKSRKASPTRSSSSSSSKVSKASRASSEKSKKSKKTDAKKPKKAAAKKPKADAKKPKKDAPKPKADSFW
jgi:hypothetical protein